MTERPIRIQLRRTKGWKMPPNTVKVDRSTKWGNPFKRPTDPAFAVLQFSYWIDRLETFSGHPHPPDRALIKTALRGKNLACWCKIGDPCHANTLLELAND